MAGRYTSVQMRDPRLVTSSLQKSTAGTPLSWIIAATSLGFVVVQLDVTLVNVALPKIADDLHAGVEVLQWVVDAYALTFAVLLLSAGSLGDCFGSKRLFMLALRSSPLRRSAAASRRRVLR